MARTFTLGDLVTRAQRRVDMENETFIAETEWKNNISTVYGELYSILIASGMRYFETEQTITAGTGTATGTLYEDYALQSDFLSNIGVDYVVNATTQERREVPEAMSQERNAFGHGASQALAHAIVGTNLRLYPAPPTGTYIHTYVPQPTDLSSSADGTSVDVVTPDGEDFLLWGVVILALIKEESDPRDAERRQSLAKERFYEWAVLRSLEQPRRRIVGNERFYETDGGW